MCKIYRVKFELLEAIYSYTRQSDIADIIMSIGVANFWLAYSVVRTL